MQQDIGRPPLDDAGGADAQAHPTGLETPRRAMEDAVFCAVVISDSAVCPYRSIVHDSNYVGAFAAMP